MSKVEEADDLDQVIFAHNEFLNAITSRSLLDPKLKVVITLFLQSLLFLLSMSTINCTFVQAIVTKLKEIFDLVIKFQETQGVIHFKMMHEVEARNHFKDEKKSRTMRVGYKFCRDLKK